jgi:tripartite-type tricarboxylate transporter receptor subunit TctC
VQRLHDEIVKVLRTNEVRTRLADGGLLLAASTPEELAQAVQRDIRTVAGIVKRARIEPE